MEEDAAAEKIRSSQTGPESTEEPENHQNGEEEENNVLNFLDSLDSYLVLIDSLSSTLRQGWLELASARHSMGTSRINSSLLDLKYHSAATSLEENHHGGSTVKSPQFTLCKWASPDNERSCSGEANFEEDDILEKKSGSPKPQHKDAPQSNEYQENKVDSKGSQNSGSPHKIDNPVQKERAKLLSMFGTLVSPKLRASQLSFETALETLVDLANMRSSMVAAYDQVQKEMESTLG